MRIIAPLLALMIAGPVVAAQNGYETVNNPENRPMLGVQMTPVPLSVQEQQGLGSNQGVYVQSVYGNTAAQTMGLQPGDVITSVNGAPISSMTELRNEVGLNQVGDPVEVTIQRGGQQQTTIGQFKPWPTNIPYDPIDPAMEQRFQEWQDRRLARMQDEVEQLRQQTQQMAKEASAAAEDQPLLGLNERAPVGADGKPLAWRFRYGIHGPAESSILPADTTATVVSGAGDPAAHPWHFTWQLASNRKPQEAL
jgi:membrane-associated protease RseP (regulator of RpoE activity)